MYKKIFTKQNCKIYASLTWIIGFLPNIPFLICNFFFFNTFNPRYLTGQSYYFVSIIYFTKISSVLKKISDQWDYLISDLVFRISVWIKYNLEFRCCFWMFEFYFLQYSPYLLFFSSIFSLFLIFFFHFPILFSFIFFWTWLLFHLFLYLLL